MSSDFDGCRICNVPDHLGDVSVRWPEQLKRSLTVFATGNVGQVPLADAIELAVRAWNDVCGVLIGMSTNPKTANLVVGVGPIDGPGNVLAQNELPVGFFGGQAVRQLQGLYDASERVVLADNPPRDKLDLGRICRHELGHFLGIGHITDGNLMAPIYSSTIRLPQNGDIVEARARYGDPVVTPPVGTTPDAPRRGSPVLPTGFRITAIEAADPLGNKFRSELNWKAIT